MQRVLAGAPYGDRIAKNIAWSTLAAGHLDDTLALVRTIAELGPNLSASLHGDLAFALARAGRPADAVAVIKAIPPQEPNTEKTVVAAGYRGAVALVAAGDLVGAKSLQAELARRHGK